MMHVFEIRTQEGRLLREYFASVDVAKKTALLEMEFEQESWYQINHHHCYHDEGMPCKQWTTVAQKGEMPVEEP
ncbi:hypothetical protein D1B31_16245 [Neobacillus notoginsengisoli]|uniref:Uncharacterized protein n=1 Tax=Neobacillus notoginsengisoli TaxID=1578198 RepID=A0A417YR41_9BACI|nr:hypothetical protein [Neobacillus notoginsengisoli]RHW37315.1 hypothetical protein D1B31_16245 [Neobacillus notoginsengisoli]